MAASFYHKRLLEEEEEGLEIIPKRMRHLLRCEWCENDDTIQKKHNYQGVHNLGQHLLSSLRSGSWTTPPGAFSSGMHANSTTFRRKNSLIAQLGKFVCPAVNCVKQCKQKRFVWCHIKEVHLGLMNDDNEQEALESIKEYFQYYHSFSISDMISEWTNDSKGKGKQK
ncbi:hypothetical protein DFQ28_003837 [Apophysomyces sp. BC1034]|nr:hypothetical protein DFQ30_002877 [Apophysomyces sp. BC1015]KAG0182171.1 hypothetical protein DFQ29_005387 [Apophysomyces sp. BC1021]KAG0193664.1 hypothetical protein DFQ28_003837 [Apophysomyces sp. BC1034]